MAAQTHEERANLATTLAETLRKRIDTLQGWRLGTRIVGGATALGALLLVWLVPATDKFPLFAVLGPEISSLHLSIGLACVTAVCLVVSLTLNEDALRARRAKAETEAAAFQVLATAEKNAANSHRAQLGELVLRQTDQFYQTVLAHVQRTSLLTHTLMTAGFLLIGVGVWAGMGAGIEEARKGVARDTVAPIAAGAGVILEFLTAGIFLFNRQSFELMDRYMATLAAYSQTMLAFNLVDMADAADGSRARMIDKWFRELVSVMHPPRTAPLVTSPVSQPAIPTSPPASPVQG
jgi:hypothetical protein